jgi:hypothetical protein
MSTRWYAYAHGLRAGVFVELPQVHHRARSSVYLHDKIALLPRAMGERLDAMRAPLRIFQFVAYGRRRRADGFAVPIDLVRDTRFRAALEFHEREGRWPYPFEIRQIRRRTEYALGLRLGEPEPEEAETPPVKAPKPAKREQPHPLGLSAAELEAALDGRSPALKRVIDAFAELRRQTA